LVQQLAREMTMELIQQYMWLIYLVGGLLLFIVLATILVRLIGGGIRGRRGSRLGISEYYEIDKTRRLVLVRRDGTEHLLLIGGPQDVVVEGGIGVNAAVDVSNHSTNRPSPPRPAIFAPRRPTLRPVREEPEM
jgi:Flagellar biosynthesis protein, FliO